MGPLSLKQFNPIDHIVYKLGTITINLSYGVIGGGGALLFFHQQFMLLFVFNIAFNNFSVISDVVCFAKRSLMLTFIVLPH